MDPLELFTLGVLSNEELSEFPAVQTDGPLSISPHVKGLGDTEFTQAVFAIDGVVAVLIPSCLDWFVVNRRGCSSSGKLSAQASDGFQMEMKSESALFVVSVGVHSSRHFIGGLGADDHDGYLRKAFAHHPQKFKP